MKKYHCTLAIFISLCLLAPMALAVDYPFQDDMEGAVNWTGDPPWELVDTDSQSPSHSWADSPGYYYDNNADVSLTLASAIDLSGAESPQLRFWHKYQIEPNYDYGYVEVSTNDGGSWDTLTAYSGYSGVDSSMVATMSYQAEDMGLTEAVTAAISEVWILDQVDLTDYAGQSNVLIRFRLETDKSIVLDGWTIDDVLIAEQPHPVTLFEITDATTKSLSLSWTQNLDPDFVAYKIYRSTTPGVDVDSHLVATINEQDTTAYIDDNLQPGTDYFYRVFVFNTVDLSAGSKEEDGTTLPGIVYYSNDFEVDSSGLTLDPPWGLTDEDAYSGTGCLTDSPGGVYDNNANSSASIAVDLLGSHIPVLRFWTRYNIQKYTDYGYVEVSTDNGTTWYKIYFATGIQEDWQEVKIDLSQWISAQTLLRFRLTSDASVTFDGWYIDDVWIGESDVELGYPFYDGMETAETASNWLASSWGLASPGHSGANYMTDSPRGKLVNTGRTSLALAGPVDLTAAQAPQLVFWQQYYLGYQDYIKVQVHNGQQWITSLVSYSNVTQGEWTKAQFDLSQYSGKKIRIRFYLEDVNGNDYGKTGWLIDDVSIQEQPVDVTLNAPDNATRYSLDLSWTENADSDFKAYRLYRATTSDVSSSSTLVAEITNQSQTVFSDDSLQSAITYYYKMYVVDQSDIWSPGSNVVSAKTLIAIFPTPGDPFSDDFESSSDVWSSTGQWGLSPEDSYAGIQSLTDSPWGNYSNNANTWVRTSVDLRPLSIPVLRFWTRYNLQEYADYGYVEVSTDNGTTWYKIYFATGIQEDWQEVKIDLSQWISAQTLLRFRLTSDASVTFDGWYIDDVWIGESDVELGYPFYDGMETAETASNWLASSWGLASPGHSGANYMTDSPRGKLVNTGRTSLALAGPVDLTAAQAPQLVFWQQYYLGYQDYIKVQVHNGQQWITSLVSYSNVTQGEWTKAQFDLSQYSGKKIRIRFYLEDVNGNDYGKTGWLIDDVSIQEQPVDVTLNAPDNATRYSLDLSWTENADSDFKAYRLYRATTSDVSSSSTLVAEITNQSQTVFSDDSLQSAITYYYKMYVVDQSDIWSPGSNVVQGKTLTAVTPLPNAPFFDDFEGGSDVWGSTGQWDLSPEDSYGDFQSLTDSPWGNYSNNANTWVRTSVDLRPLSIPVLRFWTRYNLQEYADYGYVEVSTDNGTTWYKIYFATGIQEDWQEVKIDLSQWISAQTLLRFRLTSDASVTFDGWYIDDVWIGESDVELGYPFYDGMETAETASNWLASSWGLASPGNNGTNYMTDSPLGKLVNTGRTSLALAGPVDLTAAQAPQLVFWQQYYLGYQDYIKVQVHDGQVWQAPLLSTQNVTQSVWTRAQFDLSQYSGKKIRIRFYLEDINGNDYGKTGWHIDDVYIGEDPAVTSLVDWGILDRPISVTAMANESSEGLFGWVFLPGVTDAVGQGSGIIAQLGYGPDGSYPGAGWTWVDAAYASDAGAAGEYDEYAATLTVAAIGQFDTAYRFSLDGGISWIYADTDGVDIGSGSATNGYTPSRAGSLLVTDQSLPDLIVESIVTDPPSPAAGEDATIYVTVKNQGTADAGRFFVDYYQDLGSSPVTGQAGVLYWSLDALAAGETHEFTGTAAFAQDGNYRQYAQADTDEQVDEIIESNNIIGPVDICIGGCLNDFTADGAVDGMDLEIFAANFGATGCRGNCLGDNDNNDVVDGMDLVNFILDYGRMSIFQCR